MKHIGKQTGLRLLCAAMIGISAPAMAQQKLSDGDIAKIKSDVSAAVTTYVRAFSARDAKSVVEKSYSQPSLTLGAQGATVNDPAQQIERTQGSMKRLQEAGWVRADLRDTVVCVMNPNAALASANLYRYKADGSEHLLGSETILFARTPDGWRIISIMGHEGPNQGIRCAQGT